MTALVRCYQLEPKPRIKLAAVVFAAAGKTCDCAAHAADSRKLLMAIPTAIDEARGVSSRGKRQIVTTLFAGDSQIGTGLPPLNAMR